MVCSNINLLDRGVCMVRSSVLFSIIALSAGIFAETVVKSSPPFQFPSAAGLRSGYAIQDNGVLFSYRARFDRSATIQIAWSLPGKMEKGNISIFSLAGCRIKEFPVSANQGSLEWNLSGSARPASGVYLATLSYGACKKNMQILLSR